MNRRSLIALAAGWPAVHVLAQEDTPPRPRYKISAARLHEALSARFPLRRQLGQLLQLDISAPGLLLLPARNKLGASLQLEASGAAQQRTQQGQVDVVFAVRYEPGDHSLRASDAEILDVRLPAAAPQQLELLRGLLPTLSREMLREFVLHRFAAREFALADTMGFEPGRLTVQDDGLLVEFAPKPRP